MKKRFIAGFVVLSMMMSLMTGCGGAAGAADGQSADKYALEARTYPMRTELDRSGVKEREITLYFVNGGDVPYVALTEYMPLVGETYKDDDISCPAAEYEITHPVKGHTMITRTDNGSSMDIDADKDTIDFLGMDAFVATPTNNAPAAILSLGESGVGGISNLFEDDTSSYYRSGETLITYDMSEYLIDFIEVDGECYAPMQTINDLLISWNSKLGVFTGEEVLLSSASRNLIDEMYNAPTGNMSEEFARFNYNELRFVLDHYYGLKEQHNIQNFGDFFGQTDLITDLAGTDPRKFDAALRRLTTKYLDDGHSGLLKFSFMGGKTDPNSMEEVLALANDIGTSTSDLAFSSLPARDARFKYYPDRPDMNPDLIATKTPWVYEEVGDTAILTFDTFAANKVDYYKEADLSNPQDTIELIAYADSQIKREDSPIRNVVLDLSVNVGGAADAAAFAIAWFQAGAARITVRDKMTGAESICSYSADVNLDGEFDPDDGLPDYVSKYLLITPSSFSCGNLVPAFLKGANNVTLLGKTSGGGTCTVMAFTSASGAVYAISSPLQISMIRNGSMYDIDQGVEPDFTISKYDTMYDREKLVDFIHNLP